MTPEQRDEVVRLLQQGEDLSPEWSRILFPPEKREYELVYHGKELEEDIIANILAVPLQPVRTFGANGVDWHNMLVFGDNLQAIKTLLELKKAGKLCNADGTPGVRLVYIDPPFATKQEFQGTEDQKAYQDRIVGSDYLEFLRKRFVLLRELLAEDGSICVHCDWKKSHFIRVLLDDVFGERRFVNEIIWYYTNKYGANSATFDSFHNTLFRYGRGKQVVFNRIRVPVKVVRKQPLRAWNKEQNKNEWLKNDQGEYLYKDSAEKDAGDVWEIPVINPMANERLGYPTQKPEALLDWVIRSSSRTDDLILDAFAGSGTTCAVAEKLGRRWIGIDCGKLAIYTIQKRMLNLCKEIGNKGPKLKPKPFTLFNAGLYDFSQLRELKWDDWRFFAMQLFQCRDKPHKVGGITFDGSRQGADVMVFNHFEHKNAAISEETIQEIHEAVGSRVGNKVFIIAPALTFDFQQDYIELNGVRYYALRIPYSIIHELHRREFTALKQPADEMAVNDTVEAVGFDFIRTPELEYKLGKTKPKGELFEQAFIEIKTFRSDAVVREPFRKKGNRETLSMVMLDFDYDEASQVFDLDEVQYADAIEKAGWKVAFRPDMLGKKMMAVLLDIYGNEARILIDAKDFGPVKKRATAAKVRKPPALKKAAAKKAPRKKVAKKGGRK
jgi:site-specific DNA-methyltransferase (adenine-specific)/adenine-specific DNA-methyltransferase